ncbi:hypothetical protein K402DRAFT_317220, partial [Aulographum hederae CBS 113979]
IPSKRHGKIFRRLRHTYFNVYRRLFSVVFSVNLIGFFVLLWQSRETGVNHLNVAAASSANIMAAILIRQDYIINLLFRVCWLVPLSAPLRLRRAMAKVYEYGGVHSGAGFAGALWYLFLTVVLTRDYAMAVMKSIPIMTTSYAMLTLLCLIVAFAYPRFRFLSHNVFENTHRLAGWTAVGIFWAQTVLIAQQLRKGTDHSTWGTIIRLLPFYFLLITTVHLVLPWVRLRKMTFHPERLSDHALRLHFKETMAPFSGIAISDAPLKEWHPFATFPTPLGNGGGGSLIISAAGDWTQKVIANPSTQYWVRGVPRTGVLSMACIFRSCLIVTTGSGIGPCLSFLMEPSRKQPCRVIWSAPCPEKTFGYDITEAVYRVDPRALVIDTRLSQKRPDMVLLTWQMYVESGAEAVFVISNPSLTKKLIYAMESRGVPAFGPIWDS